MKSLEELKKKEAQDKKKYNNSIRIRKTAEEKIESSTQAAIAKAITKAKDFEDFKKITVAELLEKYVLNKNHRSLLGLSELIN